MGIYLFDIKKYPESLKSFQIALPLFDNNEYQGRFMPFAYLFNGKFSEAEKLILKWKDRPAPKDALFKTYGEFFLSEITDLESKGITHPDFEKVKELLKK